MTHKEPLQLERLLSRLMFPHFDLYIHLDKKVDIQKFLYLKAQMGVFFIENRNICNWGGFSFVRAITESVREILSKDIKYEYINLVSAQDYPLKNNDYLYTFLKKNNGTNFISYEKMGESAWWEHAKNRYERYHFTDINIRGKYQVQKIVNRFSSKRSFPCKVDMYGSSNASWWILTVDCLQYILDILDQNKKLKSFMRLTWGSDEFLYPTLIMNSVMRSKTINNNYRYIHWTPYSAHPNVLSMNDFKAISESSCLFARKFDYRIDAKVLDAIDERLLNIDL